MAKKTYSIVRFIIHAANSIEEINDSSRTTVYTPRPDNVGIKGFEINLKMKIRGLVLGDSVYST